MSKNTACLSIYVVGYFLYYNLIFQLINDRKYWICTLFRELYSNNRCVHSKALHSKLLTELLSRFLSQNKFFPIFEFWVERHFFVIFGKLRISKFSKFLKFPNIQKNLFPKFPKLFLTFFLKFYTELQTLRLH